MKLPTKTVKEATEKEKQQQQQQQPQQQQQQHGPMAAPRPPSRLQEPPGPRLTKEAVFEWFGLLSPPERLELLSGLFHMCQPLELRFLGSYLEDLARRDYHVLRDFELRANSAPDLAALTDVTDPVVLSKLLICLSLLGSDNRECAGILFRTLSHIDPATAAKNSDYPPPFRDTEQRCGRAPLEHLALLLTMASLHPAFHFHQGEKFREQLDKIELAMEEEMAQTLPQHPQNNCSESFEKSILRLLNDQDEADSCDMEKILREKFMSAPPVFKQIRKVCNFFNCGSSYSTKPTSCRCNCQLGKVYHRDCSDFSSQEEDLESYVQGHKKKHGPKTPCQGLSGNKGLPGDGRRGGHGVDASGPAERRKSSSLRTSQEVEQHHEAEKRSPQVTKTKSRGLPADRLKGKEKTVSVPNGRSVPVVQPHRKDASGPDTFGETSSESYSSPSSPQHRRAESLDSEDDNNKDSDSHSDDFSKGPGPDGFLIQQTDPNAPPLKTQLHTPCPESSTDHLTTSPYLHHLPFWLPRGATHTDSSLPLVHPMDPSIVPDIRPPSGTPVMPIVPSAVSGILADPEKKDLVPPVPTLGLYPAGGSAVQPPVQRFKVALPHSQRGADVTTAASPVSLQVPVRTIGVVSAGPPPYPPPLQPDQASVGSGPPHMDTQHTTNTSLPPAPPSTYNPPSATGTQTVVPPAVPAGPPPSPSPAVTHSTAAYSECPPYSSSNPSVALGNSAAVQQAQHQQKQLLGCGACGCHNNCGGRGGATSSGAATSSCQPPLLFAGHQMAARQVFSGPPPLFQLANLCSSSYLPQAQPPHQVNGATTLSPFFPSAPPPYGPLHSQNPADILGMQAAAVAAANYSIQQQMASSFCQRVYQQQVYPNPLSLIPAATLPRSGVNKKNGNVSCYNCGISGHYAQECNQPSKDSQQGGFRLKYAASHVSEMLDNGD